MKLVNIGFGNLINADRVVSVISPDSAPAKRLVQNGKEKGCLIDATQGRKTQSVIVTDSDNIVVCYMDLKQIAARFSTEVTADE